VRVLLESIVLQPLAMTIVGLLFTMLLKVGYANNRLLKACHLLLFCSAVFHLLVDCWFYSNLK